MRIGWFILALAFATAGRTVAAEPSKQAPQASASQPLDLQRFIASQIQMNQKRILVPPGRYRVTPQDRQHLVLRGLKDVELIADGVEMVCTETTRALTIAHCTNVIVRGLIIDYDPLPFTQGRITAISADKQIYDIELFAGYPAADTARNFKYEVFGPDTRTLRCEDRYILKIETVDARHLRLTCPGKHDRDPEQVGDLIVIGSEYAPHGSAAHAIECSHNVNVRLENIDLFASNCFGFIETDCEGSTYYRCRVDRRSEEADSVRRAESRLRSLNADAFHSINAIKGPAYLQCRAQFMGDDAINIHGDYHLITASSGRELRVLAKRDLTIEPGDPVELVLYSGERLPDAKVVALKWAGTIQDDERTFVSQQKMDEGLKNFRNGSLSKAYILTLDREVNIPRGGVIAAANRMGNGFEVKDCTFGFNRSRGILIKASHGTISGNHLTGCWMSAVLVSPEYWWLESGSSSDLTITGNTIVDCRRIAICVEATGGHGEIAPVGAHENIAITSNVLEHCFAPGIRVTSTRGLRLADNRFDLVSATSLESKPVETINCEPR